MSSIPTHEGSSHSIASSQSHNEETYRIYTNQGQHASGHGIIHNDYRTTNYLLGMLILPAPLQDFNHCEVKSDAIGREEVSPTRPLPWLKS